MTKLDSKYTTFANKILEIIKTGIVEGGSMVDLYELADIAVGEGFMLCLHATMDHTGEYIYHWGSNDVTLKCSEKSASQSPATNTKPNKEPVKRF
jgi:hypothetical protein